MLAKGEILQNRYRIIRQLGHGGMGAVYEAKDERLGSSVALKEIIVEIEKIPTQQQREIFQRAFEREAKLLAGLHHEVFPRVMDYFSEENRQFLIMELVQGADLGDSLGKNKKPFAIEKSLNWADQLLDALDYLHTRQPPIFHRDIKPQNLKLTERGKIKLLDFGIAKSVDQSGSTLTNQTFIGATLDYAPIEQVLPAMPTAFRQFVILKHREKADAILNQNTDARCDIYAVGATFYHLLTNRVPVDSAQRSLQIWEGGEDSLPKPHEINEEIPSSISEWILKAMEIVRENRFSSALEMQKALQTAIDKAKSAKKTAEKIPVLPEPDSVTDDTKIFPQEAVTENLIEKEQSQIITEKKIILGTKQAQTQPSHTEPSITQTPSETPIVDLTKPSITQTPPIEPAITEVLPIEPSDTSVSGSVSKPELTGNVYFDEKLMEERKPTPVPVSLFDSTPAPKSAFNFLWLVPIFAVGVLGIGSIGGYVWLNNPTPSPTPISNSTTATPTPTVTPTITPSVSPTVTPTPEPTAQKPVVKDETPKPTVAPTIQKTPKIQVTTPTPKRPTTTPKRSDDCIYNGRCD